MEFGGESCDNTKNKQISGEKMDELIRQGKTPEQFMCNYEFDESQRNVIVFRLPTIRDIQIYDIVKTIDGYYGVVIAIQNNTYANIMKKTYNITSFSHQNLNFDDIAPGNDMPKDYHRSNTEKIVHIEVLRPANITKATSLEDTIVHLNSTASNKNILASYSIYEIVEIHKNVHCCAKIK